MTDHTSGSKKLTPGQTGSAIAIGIAMWVGANQGQPLPPVTMDDLVGGGAVALMLAWFFWPSRRGCIDTTAHQGASNGFAFRFGKALNSVWRGARRAP